FTAGVMVNLALGTSDRVNGGLSGVENATGGSGNDALTGDAGANVLIGGAGRDTILGNAGDDAITDDALGGGVIDGGPGTDALVVNGTAGADALAAFNDRVTLGTSSANVVTHAGVERLSILALGGADALTTSVAAGGPITSFDGGLGDDSITAGNVDATWTVTGKHAGIVNTGTLVSYVGVERVLGGTGRDTLVIVPIVPPPPPIPGPIKRPIKIIITDPTGGSVTPTEPPGPDDPEQPETEFSDVDEIRNPGGPSILDFGLGLFGGAVAVVGGSLILGPKPLPGLPPNPINWTLGGSSVTLTRTTPEPG
ncbi:MAG: calcium-binding protein, partial [Isosphaeraceae bacterium]